MCYSNMVTPAIEGGGGHRVDPIIEIVVDLLDTEGYEAVQLREVAKRARVSLATIYKRYATRDELIVAALEWWMEANRYAGLAAPASVTSGSSVYADLMDLFRTIFEPWEHHPLMLRSYFRARSGPGGKRLIQRGFDAVLPVARAIVAQLDSEFAEDLELILTGVVFGFLGRFTAGEIEVTDIVPGIERAVFRLTAAYDENPPRQLQPR
jgi:TetR/AcrR family transcriptional regulator, cholesterol catabolism regulator